VGWRGERFTNENVLVEPARRKDAKNSRPSSGRCSGGGRLASLRLGGSLVVRRPRRRARARPRAAASVGIHLSRPSCGGKRMTWMAWHLNDRVVPPVPIRQYVLSFPHAPRYRLDYDHAPSSPPPSTRRRNKQPSSSDAHAMPNHRSTRRCTGSGDREAAQSTGRRTVRVCLWAQVGAIGATRRRRRRCAIGFTA
jgi:hypothetical protein